MNKNQFIKFLSNIDLVKSITGKLYHSINISGDKIYFIRSHKTKYENISIDELYQFYSKEYKNKINTVIAKKYITKRAQSPAVAIINEVLKNSN